MIILLEITYSNFTFIGWLVTYDNKEVKDRNYTNSGNAKDTLKITTYWLN